MSEVQSILDDYDYAEILREAPNEAEFDVHTFEYPGPVAFAFAASNALVRAIMGPMGSGKTSATIYEHLTRAMRMPINKHGKREYVGLIIRDTYRNLYKSTVPSWWSWFPPEFGEWQGGQDRPATAKIVFEDQFGPVYLTMHFAAIGDHNAEEFFKGFEPTCISFEEGDQLPEDALNYAIGRIGRFPRARDFEGGIIEPFYRGVWMSLNPPHFDHWVYNLFVRDKDNPLDEFQQEFLRLWAEETGSKDVAYYAFFKQPSGLSPQAENMKNLPPTYYLQMMANKPWYIRRNVHGEFGYPRDGEPVYEDEFKDEWHFAKDPIKPVPGVPVDIAIDGGGHPAAVFRQKMPNGQKRYFHEIVNPRGGVGPKKLSDQINDYIDECLPGFTFGLLTGDPSMFYGGSNEERREDSDLSFVQTVKNRTKLNFKPAPSNEIAMRTDAVRNALDGEIDNEIPEVLFCPTMKVTRAGFNYKYAYKKNEKTGELVDGRKPMKPPAVSDIQDCIQYMELHDQGLASVRSKSYRKARERDEAKERIRRKLEKRGARRSAAGNFSVWN